MRKTFLVAAGFVALRENGDNDGCEYYYDGKDYCDGFYDYIHYYLDNEELVVNHFKGVDSEI